MAKKLTLERIVADHGSFVRRALANLGVPSADVSDVAQAVLMGVARGLGAFDPALAAKSSGDPDEEHALCGWLYGICARQAATYRRARRHDQALMRAYVEKRGPTSGEVDPERRFALEQARAQLLALVHALPSSLRVIVQRHELDEQHMSEVALALGIPVNTAWDRLRRARLTLRGRWVSLEEERGARPAAASSPRFSSRSDPRAG